MVNQLSKFSEHLADKTKSIRDLLCKGNQWTWGTEQKKAFQFQYWRYMTKIAVDAESYGLGGVFLQL